MPELIFIAIIALVVLGPQRLPGMLRELAKFIAQIRGLVSELTSQFSEEIAMIEELDPRKIINEVTQPINDLTKPLPDTKSKKASESKTTNKESTSTDTAKKSAATESASKSEPSSSVESKTTISTEDKDAGNGKKIDAKQVQTDPSNVASTEPYKNRTPNLNLIKKPAKDEQPDSEIEVESVFDVKNEDSRDSSGQGQEGEENRIAPPEMQEKIAKVAAEASAATEANAAKASIANGSTAAKLVAGKSVTSNSETSTAQDSESDADIPDSDLSSTNTPNNTVAES